jgi:hypothetical protein
VDPLGVAATTEIISEDPAPLEDVDGEDGAAGAEISPDMPQSDDRLIELAKQIARHRQRMLRAARTAVEEHIQIGQALIEAKRVCKHGRWAPFLKRCGLKQRTAGQCMQFARNRELIEQEAHGRADFTVEAVRKLIASKAKAIEQTSKTQSASGSDADGTGEEADRRDPEGNAPSDPGAPSQSHHRGDATVESAEDELAVAEPGEPPSTAVVTDSTADGQRCGDITNMPESVDTCGPDTDRSKPERNEAQLRASEPDEPPGQEWLASIPLRHELTDPSDFDRDAILWRRAQPLLAKLGELVEPTTDEIGKSTYYKMARNRLRLRLLFGMRVRGPHDWRICPRCRGGCTDRPGTMPCSGCDGGGFILTHDGDFQEEGQGG